MTPSQGKDNQLEVQAILDTIENNICLLDEEGNIEYVNSSWIHFAQANEADLKKVREGRNYFEVCEDAQGEDSQTARRFAEGIRSVIRGELDKIELEYPCHSPSQERWFLAKVSPYLKSETESRKKVVITHIDITRRKQEENLLNTALDALDHPFYLVDPNNYQIIRANSASGFQGADPITCYQLTHNRREPCRGEEHTCPLEIIKETQHSVKVEHLHYDKEGNVKNVEVHAHPAFSETGELKFIIEYSLDITERKKAEEALKNNEEKFKAYIREAPVGVLVVDGNGQFYEVNQEACRMRGYTREELLGLRIDDVVHSDHLHKAKEHFQEVKEKGRAEGTLMGVRKDNSIFWYDIFAVKISEDLYISFQTDVTERKEKERQLQASEEKFRSLFERNLLAIYLHDYEGNIVDVNQEVCSQSGYSREELLEMSVFDLILTKEEGGLLSKEEILQIWDQMELGERVVVEDMHQRKDGAIINVEVSTGAINYDQRKVIMAIIKDITESKKAQERINYLSFHDHLTGLYNRAFLEEEMKRLDTERQLPISIIMADLNGLKLVNDVYDHQTGDEMLKSAAEIIQNSCRKEDIIGRWGGDEFVILLPQTTEEETERIHRRIKDHCREVNVEGVPISLALGSGTRDSPEKSLEAALKEAEDSMYKQKLAEQRSARSSVLNTLLKTLQEKSYETEEHTMRMVNMAWKIGEKIGLADTELNRLSLVITLHDIGKINIPEKTLTKEGSLTEEEWEMVKTHPELGFRITRASEEFSHVAEDIIAHHERWDGQGYPKGLQGAEIPLLARITAIVDAYDVMSNGRPYKEPMNEEEIIAEIKRCAGTQFDPELVDIFLSVLEE